MAIFAIGYKFRQSTIFGSAILTDIRRASRPYQGKPVAQPFLTSIRKFG